MSGKWNLFIDYSHRICDVYYAYWFPDASVWTPAYGEIRRDNFKSTLKYSGYQVQNTEYFIESILHRGKKCFTIWMKNLQEWSMKNPTKNTIKKN